MGYSMKNEAIDTAKRAFNLHSCNCDRTKYIRNHFDYKYGRYWHCVIEKSIYYAVYNTDDDFIYL